MIGFAARILDADKKDAPKYLNSPDTPLFDKGRTLFNLHRAAPASRQSGRIVVVEGQMDVIALAAAPPATAAGSGIGLRTVGGSATSSPAVKQHDTYPFQKYEGIGATLQTEDDYASIVNLLPGGPAAVAGSQNQPTLVSNHSTADR